MPGLLDFCFEFLFNFILSGDFNRNLNRNEKAVSGTFNFRSLTKEEGSIKIL